MFECHGKKRYYEKYLMSYYHSHRPQQFADLVGQDMVRQILQAALQTDRLVHAYLFCGSRGTGKTTTARLLAKAANCQQRTAQNEPCNQCELCQAIVAGNSLDVVEIDAASNRGIEEIRQLQEQLRFRPQLAKYKVVIIDEVHMLTKEAFNALLKTLEEPPSYLIFILATTESHKLPATVLSRCQRFDFTTPSNTVLEQYLAGIAQKESLTVEPRALRQLSELANGSFRDAATLLEQVATSGRPVNLETVVDILGLPALELVDRYVAVLTGSTDSQLLADIECYVERGGNATAFIDAAFRQLYRSAIDGKMNGRAELVLRTLTQIKYRMRMSPISELPLYVSVASAGQAQSQDAPTHVVPASIEAATGLKTKTAQSLPTAQTVSIADIAPDASSQLAADGDTKAQAETQSVVVVEQPAQPAVPAQKEQTKDQASDSAANESPTVAVAVAEQVPPVELPTGTLTDHWQKAIEKLAEANQSSLIAILRTARPLAWEQPVLKVGVQFSFHADQLARQRNRTILEGVFTEVLGVPVRLESEIQPSEDLASVAEEIFA